MTHSSNSTAIDASTGSGPLIDTPNSDVYLEHSRAGKPARFAKAKEWTKLIAITGSAQLLMQAIGFACGILVIRLLPVHEYAYYTIANTMLGTMTVLADGGIASGVMSQGGKVWQDKKKLGAVLATGLKLRKKFARWSLAVSVPILYYLLIKQGASVSTATLIALSLLPTFFSALSSKLYEVSSKLHQEVTALQIIQVGSNMLRLVLTGALLSAFPLASLGIFASGAAQIYGNWRLQGMSRKFTELAEENHEVRREILNTVKRILPGAIYFAISGQISIWIISYFGNAESVAEVGALGRLSQILSLLSGTFATLIIPRYARISGCEKQVLRKFMQIQISLFLISGLIVISTAVFSGHLLWLLGNSYNGLRYELILTSFASCLSFIAGCTFSLNVSRNVVVPPQFAIPYMIVVQTLAVITQDLTETSGVIWISVITAIAYCVLQIAYTLTVDLKR